MTANPFDPKQAVVPLLDELAGSTYNEIKQVAQALPQIRHVSANLKAVHDVAQYSKYIINLLSNIAVIEYVSTNLSDFESITNNITELAALGSNVEEILEAVPDALASELKAKDWAEKAVNSPVEIGLFSAKHHAAKALASEGVAITKAGEAASSAAAAAASASLITGASWVMTLGLEVSGGNTYVKVTGYTGGIGTAPTTYVGWYLTAAGGYDPLIANAVSIRGPTGPGSGDMLAEANLSDLINKVTAFSTIKQPATTAATGVARFATQAEALAGTATDLILTPALLRTIIPLGVVWDYTAGEEVLPGFIFPYGQAISRTTYAAYFAKVGTTYGVGNGSTTFNVPDICGRTVFGKDNMGGVSKDRLTAQSGGINGDVLGAVGGAERHQLTEPELAMHNHTKTGTGRYGANRQSYSTWQPAAGDSDWQTQTLTVDDAGGDVPHNNIPPGIVLNKILFVGA